MQILVCKFWCANFGMQIETERAKRICESRSDQLSFCQTQNGIPFTDFVKRTLETLEQINNLPHMCGFVSCLCVAILDFQMLLRNCKFDDL